MVLLATLRTLQIKDLHRAKTKPGPIHIWIPVTEALIKASGKLRAASQRRSQSRGPNNAVHQARAEAALNPSLHRAYITRE